MPVGAFSTSLPMVARNNSYFYGVFLPYSVFSESGLKKDYLTRTAFTDTVVDDGISMFLEGSETVPSTLFSEDINKNVELAGSK